MIQFNLLPDVKIEFIKARRSKRTVMLIATLSAGTALTVLVTLFLIVNVAQKKYMRDLTRDIKKYDTQLQGTKDLDKILTVQNQLNNLGTLHDQKPVASRLFGYLATLTPTQASISSIKLDFGVHTISIAGAADSIPTVNKFADTLKFTTYSVKDSSVKATPAFSNVVLQSFTRATKATQYQIDAVFDPAIFDAKAVTDLIVPNTVTTRSETNRPGALFAQ